MMFGIGPRLNEKAMPKSATPATAARARTKEPAGSTVKEAESSARHKPMRGRHPSSSPLLPTLSITVPAASTANGLGRYASSVAPMDAASRLRPRRLKSWTAPASRRISGV
eukprot:scaffold7340_cov266-Pinguiococcus_pyrenoidosus.AAC.28